MISIAIDNGRHSTVGGGCYSAHQAVSKFAEHHIDMVSCVHRKCQTRAGVSGDVYIITIIIVIIIIIIIISHHFKIHSSINHNPVDWNKKINYFSSTINALKKRNKKRN